MNGFSEILEVVDGPVRLLTFGELLLLAVILVTRRPQLSYVLPILTLAACVACYLYLSGPWPPSEGLLRYVLIGLTSLTPFALWALAMLFFVDGFRLPRWVWPAAAAMVLTAALVGLAGEWQTPLRNVIRIASLSVLLHAVWVLVRGLRDDLVEKRRIARIVVVGLVLVQASASLITELALPEVTDRQPLEPVSAIIILLLTSALATALLRPELLETQSAEATPKSVSGEFGDHASPLDPIAKDLARLVEAGGLFESGLSIAGLAKRLGVPEYRLRRTINRELGYRNFSSFLNHHRIVEARRRLRDPDMARLPVLTVAMDLGYGSLGPFNRAFREAVGMTPTEFRRGSSKENLADS